LGKDSIRDALPVQEAAVKNGIFSGQSLLVIAPTSSGKTFLGEMLALAQAVRGSRSIYLVPLRQLLKSDIPNWFHDILTILPSASLHCFDRDHHEHDSDLLNGKYDIAILTYENSPHS